MLIDKYEIIVIGSGFAGCSATVYAGMSNKKCLMISGETPGGLIVSTDIVDNYVGMPGVSGMEMGDKMLKHAEKYGDISYETVRKIKHINGYNYVYTDLREYKCRSVIICTGSSPRKLNHIHEKALYCAVCDGFLYKDKVVAVIGGGNSAFEAALYLSGLCKRVYLIHRSDKFRAFDILQKQVRENNKIDIIAHEEVVDFDDQRLLLSLKNQELNDIHGVFVCIGHVPNTEFVNGFVNRSTGGFIETNEHLETNIPGVYAAGDVVENEYNQGVVAAGDGARAALNAVKYCRGLE